MLKGLTGTNERIRLHDGEMNKAATVKANPYLLKIALKISLITPANILKKK